MKRTLCNEPSVYSKQYLLASSQDSAEVTLRIYPNVLALPLNRIMLPKAPSLLDGNRSANTLRIVPETKKKCRVQAEMSGNK